MGGGRRVGAIAIPAAAVLAAAALVAIGLGAFGGSSEGPGEGTADSAHEPGDGGPNVVVVMTDDQALDTMPAMSQTRRLLADGGVTFSQSLASFPLCCPSRSTFLTGQYAHNHGVLDNSGPRGGITRLDQEDTLPVWLSEAGYRTAFVGKYLNGYGKADAGGPTFVPPGWSEWYASPANDKKNAFDYPLNENGELVDYGDEEADYKTDAFADKAVRFIGRQARRGRPFFLWVATSAPHIDKSIPDDAPRNPVPAPRHEGADEGTPLPRGPAFDEDDVSDKPRFVRELPRIGPRLERRMERIYVSQLESLRAVDDLVGRVVGALERAGELEDTIVVFTSDNGFLRGQHRFDSGKSLLYEESVRVPLLVRGPGFPAGTVADSVVANVDLAATIVEATGAKPGVELDGETLTAALDPDDERAVLLEVFERRQDRFRAVRARRHVYAEHDGDRPELYDLERDPDQLDNVADSPDYRATREELAARLGELRDCAGESCR